MLKNENIENVATVEMTKVLETVEKAHVAEADHTVIKLAVPTQNIISTRMNLCHYKPEKIQTIEEQRQAQKQKALLASLKPEIVEPKMDPFKKDAFFNGRNDFLYIYPELMDDMIEAGIVEDIGAVRSLHYYSLNDKLLIKFKDNKYTITDRYLYTRTGEVLDLSIVLQNFALFDDGYIGSNRSQIKFSVPDNVKEYFNYASSTSITRLLVVLMENGDITKAGIIDRRYISSDFEIHHEGMTWCNCLNKLIYLTKKEHRAIKAKEKAEAKARKKTGKNKDTDDSHRELNRIICTGADMIEMLEMCA